MSTGGELNIKSFEISSFRCVCLWGSPQGQNAIKTKQGRDEGVAVA